MALEIGPGVVVDEDELEYRYGPSSGPGGQNVNKVETRVTVLFPLRGSRSLDAEQVAQIEDRLHTRVNKAGVLRVTAQKERTREANRRAALSRLAELLAAALAEPLTRVGTRVPLREKRRRRREKARRSRVKALRSEPDREG